MRNIVLLGFLFATFLLAILSYAFVDPNLSYYHQLYTGFAFQKRLLVTSIYTIILIILFGFYVTGLRVLQSINKKQLVFFIGCLCVIFLFAYPTMLSYDIFNYLTTAKVFFFYHENPYLIMPIAFLGDPFLLFTHAANKIALYAPVWILLTGIPFTLGIGNFFATIVSFKLMTTLFYLLTILVLWKLTRSRYTILLFAFNPLILIEILLSGHNDIVMMFFALFSFLLLKQKRYFFAILCLLVSILIKYATLFLLPVFLFVLIKSFRKKTIDWKKIFFVAALSMFLVFLLSPIREEMYPWYATWFLPFVFLIPERKVLLYSSIAFSFGLLLRYLPFMYTGSHFGVTPYAKVFLMILPVVIVGIVFMLRRKK